MTEDSEAKLKDNFLSLFLLALVDLVRETEEEKTDLPQTCAVFAALPAGD